LSHGVISATVDGAGMESVAIAAKVNAALEAGE
jgi:hypothetical protein